jgi:LysM repeat protein
MNTKPLFRLSLSLLLALAIFASALPQPAMAASNAPTVACAKTYTVKQGDTTKSIAIKFGVPWGDIARANNLTQPYTITPGQKLCIPYKKGTTPLKGTITMKATSDKLTITASNFKDTSGFFVKVKDAVTKNAPWYKIGSLLVSKTKNPKSTTFTLPKELKNAVVLSVCLKNVYTDDLTCYSVPHSK